MSASFGHALKSVRQDQRLSQEALAIAIGSTQRHISFLETGRSQPTREMIGRLCAELNLNPGLRAVLFEASGFQNPYRRRDFTSTEVRETLDMLEARVLRHWPFPAMVIDTAWTVLRLNTPARAMFSQFVALDNKRINMLEMFLSDAFLARIRNWEEASLAFYSRLHKDAPNHPAVAETLTRLKEAGLFDHIPGAMSANDHIPVFVPFILEGPNGRNLTLTSVLGQLASVHDVLVDGFEIEFMVPVDAETEACLLSQPS